MNKIINIDCPSCATKIEEHLKKNNIESKININNETIKIKHKDIKEANKLIKQIEPKVKIIDEHDHSEHNHGINKFQYLMFAAAIVVLIIANLTQITLLYFVSYLFVGYEILHKTYLNLKNKNFFDENFLMSLATLCALGIAEYNEAIIILMFYQVGEYFEAVAVNKSKKSIESMLDNRDNNVTLENLTVVDITSVNIGDIILIKPNEVVSLDGIVLDDNIELDESSINGESKTKIYSKNQEVLSGTINTSKQFRLKVTNDYKNSYATKVKEIILDAQSNSSDTERFITKFAKIYTPVVVFSSIVIFIVQLLIGISFNDAVYTAVIFLVISCPCALVISIPLGYFGGIGLSSKHNILVKGSQYLEGILSVDHIAFDKTGTITDGKFKVIEVVSTIDKQEFINLLCSAEQNSSHVIARQIVKELDYTDLKLDDVKEVTSKGLEFTYNGDLYKIGSNKFIQCEKVKSPYTPIYVSRNDMYIGHVLLGDELRKDVKNLFATLHENNIQTHILSGDERDIIENIANELQTPNYHGGLLAEEKLEYIKNLQSNDEKVLFIGDGVNDAPSIVGSDIGVSVGSNATTIAVETSDIVLINNTPNDLIKLRKISKKTRQIVYQNITLSLGVKILFLILATFGVSSIYEAIFADVGVALVAILNAYRLIKINIDKTT